MISNPTNFNHVAHMGPGDGMQVLMDLPLVRAQQWAWGSTRLWAWAPFPAVQAQVLPVLLHCAVLLGHSWS